jgi:hypothetical protein
VGRLRFALYAAPAYVERRWSRTAGEPMLRAAEMLEHDFVGFDKSLAALPQATFLASQGADRLVFRSNSDQAQLDAVEQGQGIGVLPCAVADAMPSLVRISFDAALPSVPIFLVYHRDVRQVPCCRFVLDALAPALRQGLATPLALGRSTSRSPGRLLVRSHPPPSFAEPSAPPSSVPGRPSALPPEVPSVRIRAVFVEDLEPTELCTPEVVKLLGDRSLEAIVSVRPWNIEETLHARATLEAAGVPVTLWPMLDDAAGRWVNVRTIPAMSAFIDKVIDHPLLDARSSKVRLLLDREPPIHDVKAVVQSRSALALAKLAGVLVAAGGSKPLDALVERLRAADIELSAAEVPFVLADGPLRGVSRLLGVGSSPAGIGTAWIMAYTTLFSGYSRGYIDRAKATSMLAAAARRTRRRRGPAGALALGCVGPGALGDEAVYQHVDELAEDVAIAVRAGIDRLALFDLRGVLRRSEPAAWLDAFVATPGR